MSIFADFVTNIGVSNFEVRVYENENDMSEDIIYLKFSKIRGNTFTISPYTLNQKRIIYMIYNINNMLIFTLHFSCTFGKNK